jgi:hypothetical protein
MVRSAIERGLDGLAFSDHHRLMPEDLRAELNGEFAPFRVYSGVEMNVAPADTHVLVFGVSDPALEYGDWRYDNLHTFVRDRGGYLVLAHPFRENTTIEIDMDAHPPDGIELFSPNIPPDACHRIRVLASRLRLAMFSHSDGHGISTTGGFFNTCNRMPDDNDDILRALKAREFTPSLDPRWMRPHLADAWRPFAQPESAVRQ